MEDDFNSGFCILKVIQDYFASKDENSQIYFF